MTIILFLMTLILIQTAQSQYYYNHPQFTYFNPYYNYGAINPLYSSFLASPHANALSAYGQSLYGTTALPAPSILAPKILPSLPSVLPTLTNGVTKPTCTCPAKKPTAYFLPSPPIAPTITVLDSKSNLFKKPYSSIPLSQILALPKNPALRCTGCFDTPLAPLKPKFEIQLPSFSMLPDLINEIPTKSITSRVKKCEKSLLEYPDVFTKRKLPKPCQNCPKLADYRYDLLLQGFLSCL